MPPEVYEIFLKLVNRFPYQLNCTMRYFLRPQTLLLFLFVYLSSCAIKGNTDSVTEVAKWEEQASRVTIMRDDFGVPHIYGKTDADAVFGLLYAQCEDDFNRVERNYLWATGRLAEVEGEEMLYSDLRAKLYMTEEEAKAEYEKSPEWLKAALPGLCRRHQLLPAHAPGGKAEAAHAL
jgi:acyl-homoserine-lactone acylase